MQGIVWISGWGIVLAAPVHVPIDFWRKHWPVMLGAIALMIVVILIRGSGKGRPTAPGNTAEGWRVGHEGRDSMFYEEKHGGGWRRIPIPGEMLMGRAHHVIYFASIRFPDWAEGRREEIIGRIKSAFPEPDYEYDERRWKKCEAPALVMPGGGAGRRRGRRSRAGRRLAQAPRWR